MEGLIKETTLTDIANAIRENKQVDTTYTPSQMVCALNGISLKDFIEGNFGETVYIPDGVEYFNTTVFSGREDIKKIVLPNTVKVIGEYAFNYKLYDCDEFVIPASVQTIRQNAFSHGSYKKFIFLGFPQSFGFESFWEHPDKTYISSIEDWIDCDFTTGIHGFGAYTPYGTEGTYINNVLAEHIEIPEGPTVIKSSVFCNWSYLKTIVIPESITTLGTTIFFGCENLTHITLKGTPTSIDPEAFNTNSTNPIIIRVPWAEGEVEGAPWGAMNATVIYNYK